MEIFGETIERELPDLVRQGVRTRFIGRRDRARQGFRPRCTGRRDRASERLREQMARLEGETAQNDRLQLWVALDYGGGAGAGGGGRRAGAAGKPRRGGGDG